MKRTIILAAFFVSLVSTFFVYALEVDVDELQTQRVRFINYQGPHTKTESIRQVKSIGYRLAEGAKREGDNTRYPYLAKYSVIRAISKDEPEKFSADIISLDKNAKVSHIKYVRRIVQAYLERMYNYSPREAYALSIVVSYYNAIYRGNLDYFASKYKKTVISHINKNNAGISTKYYEWPGTTRLIIPLTEASKRDKIDSIDPFLLSDKNVRGAMRKDDKTTGQRKDLVKMKERSLKKDKERLAREKEQVAKEKEDIKKKKEAAEKERQQQARKEKNLQKEKQNLQKEKKQAAAIKDPGQRKKKQEEVAAKEKKVQKEEKQLTEDKKQSEQKKEAIAKDEKKIRESEKNIERKEENIAKKEENIKEDKKEIAQDEIKQSIAKNPTEAEKKLTAKAEALEKKEEELDRREDRLRDSQPDKNVFAEKFYYLKIKKYLEGGHYNNELYMINAATRKVDFVSPVKNICGQRYDIFSGGIVVISHRGSHKSGHFLTLIDRKNLQALKTGKENIFWRSFIEIRNNHIYAIVRDNSTEKHYLGKFNTDLEMVARSKVEISNETFITFYKDNIYINRFDKKILVLKDLDLSEVEIIEPAAE